MHFGDLRKVLNYQYVLLYLICFDRRVKSPVESLQDEHVFAFQAKDTTIGGARVNPSSANIYTF